MNLKRRMTALVLAGGLAVVGAACEAETGVEDPAVIDPIGDPAGDPAADDLGGTEDTAP